MNNWKNYTFCYTNVDKKELMAKMKRAWRNMVFVKPLRLGTAEFEALSGLCKIERLVLQLSTLEKS